MNLQSDNGKPKNSKVWADVFSKRAPAHPLPDKKTSKKVKVLEDQVNDPLSQILSWRDKYKQFIQPQPDTFQIIVEPNIVAAEAEKWAKNVQAIFINIDWHHTSIEQLTQLRIPQTLLSNGIIFIWGAKGNIGALFDYFDSMGYSYVENFSFVMLNRNKIPQKTAKKLAGNHSLLNFVSISKKEQTEIKVEHKNKDYEIGRVSDPSEIFENTPAEFFKESQKVLYMFRKINKKESLQLRHQRTSDAFFTISDDNTLDWRAKDVVYSMIETLLINGNYKAKESLKFVELWADKEYPRKGWVSVCQDKIQ